MEDTARATSLVCLKIAFDIGGVLSKYPQTFKPIIQAMLAAGMEVFLLTDMPVAAATSMLELNGLADGYGKLLCADYATHGEWCKAILCQEHSIDVLIDDHMGYVSSPNAPLVRLLVMPDLQRSYHDENWKVK